MSRPSLVSKDATRTIIELFKAGASVAAIARSEGLAAVTVERLIRTHMIEGPTWLNDNKGTSI